MKKSEFEADIEARAKSGGGYLGSYAAEVAERHGAKFDPEEPERPERVVTLGSELAVTGEATVGLDWEAVTREAAACYNFVRRLDLDGPRNMSIHPTEFLLSVLREEREKLRTP